MFYLTTHSTHFNTVIWRQINDFESGTMLSSLDPKSTDTRHSNRDCSANFGRTETKTIIWRLRRRAK